MIAVNVCAVWLENDWLHRYGWRVVYRADHRIAVHPDGRLTYRLDGVCRHDPADCPPHKTRTARKEAA